MTTLLARKKVLDAAKTGSGVLDLRTIGGRRLTAYVSGSGTITAGTVKIETATDPNYTGTWHQLGSDVTVAAGQQIVQADGPFGAVRARVSADVTGGGNVSVVLVVI